MDITRLEREFEEVMSELKINEEIKRAVRNFLALLKEKSEYTYAHSLRVGLLARKIARFLHLDEKALFFAGVFHDLGKSLIPLSTLHKTSGWTAQDSETMKAHVMDSWRLLRDKFNFSADIVLLHHRFQRDPYPVELPELLDKYPEGVKVLIQDYGRILAIADVYDALHRKNDKFEEGAELTGEQIREKMLALNEDRKDLVEELYNVGILERGVISTDTPSEELYEKVWVFGDGACRNPEETARFVMLAAALEPLSDKAGCTTRFTDISRHLKLEYFVTGAINIGWYFEKLARAIDRHTEHLKNANGPLFVIYEFTLWAQNYSVRNRSGGRINQGIIELLTPIVAAQHYFDPMRNLDTEKILERSQVILKKTRRGDVDYLIKMKRFAHDLCRYNDRPVPEHPEAKNVFEYYAADLSSSASPTGVAHNGEFVNGFPTVKLMYETIMNSTGPSFMKKVEEAFRHGVGYHHKDVGRGFLADCVAAAIYLCFSQNPKIRLIV